MIDYFDTAIVYSAMCMDGENFASVQRMVKRAQRNGD